MKFVKHIHVLHLLSQIPAPVLVLLKPTDYYKANVAMTTDEAGAAWDHMFTYIHTHWAEPLTAGLNRHDERRTAPEMTELIDCRAMLCMKHDELVEKLETLPPYFREEIFPVAIARYLLRDLQLPVLHRKITTFSEFHRRYGTMVLGC